MSGKPNSIHYAWHGDLYEHAQYVCLVDNYLLKTKLFLILSLSPSLSPMIPPQSLHPPITPSPSAANSLPGPVLVLAFVCCWFWANSHLVVQLTLELCLPASKSVPSLHRVIISFSVQKNVIIWCNPSHLFVLPCPEPQVLSDGLSVFFLCLPLAVSKFQALR